MNPKLQPTKQIYLDYAAATPLDPTVSKKMREAEKCFANPSSIYASGRKAKEQLDAARKRVAMFFGANAEEIVFTSGATEANNLAILGAARAAGKGRIISIATEHSSVREPINQLQKEGFSIDWCKIDKYGRVDQKAFTQLLSQDTILVSINYANSEIGTIQSITKLVQIVREYEAANGTRIIFHTDASAALEHLNCSVSRLGVDLLSCSAAKIYGPKGIGLLYVRRGTQLQQIVYGGAQEAGLRSGTESLSLTVGLACALGLIKEQKQPNEHRQLYIQCMHNLNGINCIENGHPTDRLFSILSICLQNVSGEDLVAYLDADGIEVATGAACEASNDQPSAALLAIGRSAAQAQGSLRVSFGRGTKNTDIDIFVKSLKKSISTLS